MADDILYRYKQVQKSIDGAFKFIHAEITPVGRIIFTTGKGCFITGWLFIMAACIGTAWIVYAQPEIQGFIKYLILAVSGFLALCLLISARGWVEPQPYFEIDPAFRRISIYGGFPVWRPKQVIQIDDIKLIVAYGCRWSESSDSWIYAVTESGTIHPLISHLGSVIPDNAARILGFICNKLAMKVEEKEPVSGPLAGQWNTYMPKTGKHVDIQQLLNIAVMLYDPESADIPDWVH